MESPDKKQRAARFPLEFSVEARWQVSGQQVIRQGTTRNISCTGVYFLAEQAPAVGTRSDLTLRLPITGGSGEPTVVRCQGEVLRVEPQPSNRVGVAYRIDQYQLEGHFMQQGRRSPRMLWRAPVAAMWTNREGGNCQAVGESEVVNAHGGLIRLPTRMVPQDNVEIMHMRTREIQPARIVWREPIPGGREVRVGVELSQPSENFWGVRVPFGPSKS